MSSRTIIVERLLIYRSEEFFDNFEFDENGKNQMLEE
jgi:hypothetical protein